MTKQELYKLVAKRSGIDPATVVHVCDTMLEAVADTLEDGETIYVGPLGMFGVKVCGEKVARDILRAKSVMVPAHRVVKFKPSVELARRIKDIKPE